MAYTSSLMKVCEIVMKLCELVQFGNVWGYVIMFDTYGYLCFLCSLCCDIMRHVLVRCMPNHLVVNMLTYDQGMYCKFH